MHFLAKLPIHYWLSAEKSYKILAILLDGAAAAKIAKSHFEKGLGSGKPVQLIANASMNMIFEVAMKGVTFWKNIL